MRFIFAMLMLGGVLAVPNFAFAADPEISVFLRCEEIRHTLQGAIWAAVENRVSGLPVETDGLSTLLHIRDGIDRAANNSYLATISKQDDGQLLLQIAKNWVDASIIQPTEGQFIVDGVPSQAVPLRADHGGYILDEPLKLSYFLKVASKTNSHGYTFPWMKVGDVEWFTLECDVALE
jgi:hypothetical protein